MDSDNTGSPPGPQNPTFTASRDRYKTASSQLFTSQPPLKRPIRKPQPLGPAEPSRVSKAKNKPKSQHQTDATRKPAGTRQQRVCQRPSTAPVPWKSAIIAKNQIAKSAAERKRKMAASSTSSANGHSVGETNQSLR